MLDNIPNDELVTLALKKSFEMLDNAELNLNNGFLTGAFNRIYYAIFYSVKALSYLKQFDTTTHIDLMYWFNINFIEENNVFNENLYFIYLKSYEIRIKYDYDVTLTPQKEEVVKNLEEAKLFVNTISDYIKHKLVENQPVDD